MLSWEGTAQGRIAGGSYGASGSVTASITGGVNTTIEFNAGTVTRAQLEVGTSATPFEHRPYGMELALCQRYYYRMTATGPDTLVESGSWYSATQAACFTVLPVQMRVAPTALEQSGTASDYQVFSASAASLSCSSTPVFNAASVRSATTIFTYATGGQTVGAFTRARAAVSGAYLGWSAEL